MRRISDAVRQRGRKGFHQEDEEGSDSEDEEGSAQQSQRKNSLSTVKGILLDSAERLAAPGAINDVERLLRRMLDGLDIKSRWYRGSVYPECFVGSDCISWFVAEGFTTSRVEALALGNSLIDLGHFQHVTGDHLLEDRYLFYRLSASRPGNKRKELQASSSSLAKKIQLQNHQITELWSLLIKQQSDIESLLAEHDLADSLSHQLQAAAALAFGVLAFLGAEKVAYGLVVFASLVFLFTLRSPPNSLSSLTRAAEMAGLVPVPSNKEGTSIGVKSANNRRSSCRSETKATEHGSEQGSLKKSPTQSLIDVHEAGVELQAQKVDELLQRLHEHLQEHPLVCGDVHANEHGLLQAGEVSSSFKLNSVESAAEQLALRLSPRDLLLVFLRAKAYNVDAAATCFGLYIRFRADHGWGAAQMCRRALRSELESCVHAVFGTDCCGRRVVLFRPCYMDLSRHSMVQLQMMASYVLWRALVVYRDAQVYGCALLADFSGFTLGQMRRVQLADIKRGVQMVQGSFPLRLGAVYVLCEPRWFSLIVGMLQPLLRSGSYQRLRSRLFLFGKDGLHDLHTHIPQSSLPSEYGGTAGDLETEWQQWLDVHCEE
jgi:hypothetical protein